MISCRLIFVTRNHQGLRAANEILITGESIEVGRRAASQIRLPDHRVSLHHATVTRSQDGSCWIEATRDAWLGINGFVERVAKLSPGMRIGIGPYLLTVENPEEDADLVLSVEMPTALDEPVAPAEVAQMASLSVPSIGKRRMSLWLAAIILFTLFALPLATRLSPAYEDWQAGLPVALTSSLEPGPLAAGHAPFGAKCSSCHQQAFEAVADAACTKCHEQVGTHQAENAVQDKAFGTLRCADCHPAHQGKRQAMQAGLTQCVACHRSQGKTIGDVRDFDTTHPSFHLSIPDGKRGVRIRLEEGGALQEKTGLKFSHQVHLAKEGVASPDGDTVLSCRSCHRLEESGRHFAPMAMEMTCQQSRCHRSRFEKPAAGFVPHGSVGEAMNIIRSAYDEMLSRSPGEVAARCGKGKSVGVGSNYILACAERLAREHAASTLFRQSGEELQCALCHEISATEKSDQPWKIAPARTPRDWQPKAVFNHAKHGTVACTECHDKANSKSSADVSFPRMEKCRECHAGSAGAKGRVASRCEGCHVFHRTLEAG